jgi:hypothetical protein
VTPQSGHRLVVAMSPPPSPIDVVPRRCSDKDEE